ncbi:hypothetical protein ITJ86_09525 [Winogradskyella sp. F6397]|uniref:DUF4158 domain-containing protein n=1 Tax=Winogradskyella marina TaxID=2785530 RepID=A0ABS0EJ17_9FLAO|nr:hypothetical protein [Winogradskyella marina]MBF8150136.1 hypothetical protein [Winogradskyella marina]
MEIDNAFSYSYNRHNGLRFGFLLQTLFCSNIDEFDRKLIYILHVSKILPDNILKYCGDKIDKDFLLKFMFQKTDDKKIFKAEVVRELVRITDRGTFIHYFDKLGFKGRRSFTLSEVYVILKHWYGEKQIIVFNSLKIGDLASRFTEGNYEKFEEDLTNNKIINLKQYRANNFIKPKDLVTYIESVKGYQLDKIMNEDEQVLEYFDLITYLFLLSMFN